MGFRHLSSCATIEAKQMSKAIIEKNSEIDDTSKIKKEKQQRHGVVTFRCQLPMKR